jgi:cobalt-zinc-cadmium efflux system membrane fusion protein
MGLGQRIVVVVLLTVVILPPAAGFYSYFTGKPLHLLASAGEAKEVSEPEATSRLSLVSGQKHTLDVPEEVSASLGIQKGVRESVAIARAPSVMRPLVLPGSTQLDPTRLARIRARFAPARVIQLVRVEDRSPKTGYTEFREVRQGDRLRKGDLLGVFYSVDVGSKKNDLLNGLVQLELDQKMLDQLEANRYAIPLVQYLTQISAVQKDRNAINQALNNLTAWDIPQDEIDSLHAEARKLSADKDAWYKTREGRWVRGEKHSIAGKVEGHTEGENPWGRVTLRAPFDGVIVERNVHEGEMVVDNTVNLFQLADVNRLQVIAKCREEDVPTLEALHGRERQWTVRTVGIGTSTGLPGTIDQIGYVIDPNDHTAVVTGYVDNPGQRIRAGQYITATVQIPPPTGVVEIPADAVVDDGIQSLVFVQDTSSNHRFSMRRVEVSNRFDHSVFIRATALAQKDRLTTREADEGLLPKEPLRPGERVLLSGAVELKAALLDLESRQAEPSDVRKR